MATLAAGQRQQEWERQGIASTIEHLKRTVQRVESNILSERKRIGATLVVWDCDDLQRTLDADMRKSFDPDNDWVRYIFAQLEASRSMDNMFEILRHLMRVRDRVYTALRARGRIYTLRR